MPRSCGSIDDKTILVSSSIVFNKGEIVAIKPFDFDDDFKIIFDVDLRSDLENFPIETDAVGSKSVKINIKRKWNGSNRVGLGYNRNFAGNEESYFSINFSLETIGNESKYTAIIHYSIMSGPRK